MHNNKKYRYQSGIFYFKLQITFLNIAIYLAHRPILYGLVVGRAWL